MLGLAQSGAWLAACPVEAFRAALRGLGGAPGDMARESNFYYRFVIKRKPLFNLLFLFYFFIRICQVKKEMITNF